jgi:hypothetical protein
VIASAAQAAAYGGEAGVYVVGTGNTGAAQTFMTLGIVYFIVMIIAAFQYRVPAEGWRPAGWVPKPVASGMVTSNNVHINQALKTPQFWQLWIMLCFNVTAGIGVIGVAKTMMTEIFGTGMPLVVTAAFASTYVLMISVFNMVGRFFWASTSDFIGRKATYMWFFVLGTILYLSIPYFASAAASHPSMIYLIAFYAATMIIFLMYGGGFATIPAFLADMFGTMHVGGIHGRLLTAGDHLAARHVDRQGDQGSGRQGRSRGLCRQVRRAAGSAAAAGGGQDRDYRQADGNRARRHDRPDPVALQYHHVLHGSAAGRGLLRQPVHPAGEGASPPRCAGIAGRSGRMTTRAGARNGAPATTTQAPSDLQRRRLPSASAENTSTSAGSKAMPVVEPGLGSTSPLASTTSFSPVLPERWT